LFNRKISNLIKILFLFRAFKKLIMNIVDDVLSGASEAYESLFNGGMEKGTRNALIAGIIIFVIVIIFIFVAYYIYKKKNSFLNRTNSTSGGCCRTNQLFRQGNIMDPELSNYDLDVDFGERRGEFAQRYNADGFGFAAVPFSPGSGFDNAMQSFSTSKPDATFTSANGLNPNSAPALVHQTVPRQRNLRPTITEEDYINFAGRT
jgi:hypothetical protein